MSTQLRPECGSNAAARTLDYAATLRRILRAVNRRRGLIRGRLNDKDGKHCAMGCFWADNPSLGVMPNIVDEIAAVNDSLSDRAKPKTRWLKVRRYLRERLAAFESDRASKP